MQEIIKWIDRENARHNFVVQHREKGLWQRVICCLIVRDLAKRDPMPEVLKEALRDCV